MDKEIRQRLLSLESRDHTEQWFNRLHGRELSARRAREINAASRQAREYFRNAGSSDYSVRPLLTFYGVSSLSRALTLLFKSQGGEEGLTSGHGLQTVSWGNVLSGATSSGLKSLSDLKVEICGGLFLDLLEKTDNETTIHIRSSGVDWSLPYETPENGDEISLGDLFSRIPSLRQNYGDKSHNPSYASVSEVTYSQDDGFYAKVKQEEFSRFKSEYTDRGYDIECDDEWCEVSCKHEVFSDNLPFLLNNYLNKTFGSIPGLYIVSPLPCGKNFSQLGALYIISFFLGMLVRYYPTHWMSLIQGSKGDELWPTINKSQTLLEEYYPELVTELIHYSLDKSSD